MNLPKFKYLSPPDLKEAFAAIKEFNGRIAVFAGGTELVPHLKWRLKSPDYLLSLKNIADLRTLRYDRDTGFTLGAMCSLRNLAAHADVKSKMAALAQGAEKVASPQIRNKATIGGNVCLDTRCWYYDRSKEWRTGFPICRKAGGDQCHVVKGGRQCYALFQADTVPGLLVLNAELKLVGAGGERIIPLEAFYSGLGEAPNRISADEILTEIHIPNLPPYSSTTYLKYQQRGVLEFPILGVASRVTLDQKGKSCREARFAFVGHGPKPLLIEATELLKDMDEPVLPEDVLSSLLQEVKPVNHMGVSASLKRRMARLLVKNSFRESWEMAQKSIADPT